MLPGTATAQCLMGSREVPPGEKERLPPALQTPLSSGGCSRPAKNFHAKEFSEHASIVCNSLRKKKSIISLTWSADEVDALARETANSTSGFG